MKTFKLFVTLFVIFWALPVFAQNVLGINYVVGTIDLPKDKPRVLPYYKPCMAQSEKECLQDRNFFLHGTVHFYPDNTGKFYYGHDLDDEIFTWCQEGSDIIVSYEGSTFKKAGETVKLKTLNGGMMLLFDDAYYGHESLEK